jgi:hypothetical protein
MPDRAITLWIHSLSFSKADVVINPEFFPGVLIGDLFHVYKTDSQVTNSNKLIVEVKTIETEILIKQTHLQISISQDLANLFELNPRAEVYVVKISPESIAADYLEVSFRDQYANRSLMWDLKTHVSLSNSLVGSLDHACIGARESPRWACEQTWKK